jgi:molecular chaperone GrpE
MGDDEITIDPDADIGEGEATPEARLKKLRDELKKVRTERDEHLAGWQRAKADYINLQRRMQESAGTLSRAGVQAIALDLLSVYDSLESALLHAESEEVKQGLGATIKQFVAVLTAHGVKKLEVLEGAHFDPHMHEPVEIVATDEKARDNTVARVLQSGFLIHDTILRPARVAVYHL